MTADAPAPQSALGNDRLKNAIMSKTTVVDALTTTPAASAALQEIIDTLAAEYPGSLHLPADPTYAASNSYWAANVEATPHAIFTPPSHAACAHALRILSASNTPFSVRSGGHSPNNHFAASPSFVLNLQTLNTLSLNADKSELSLGPGLPWENVYNFLEPQGLTVPGGRVSTVGVGGFLLGGGISFAVGAQGFSANSITAYKCALASGEIITASATSHPELFIALKGSGAPFCIVLEFTMRTYPLSPHSWGGVLSSMSDSMTGALEAAVDFLHNGTADTDAHLITSMCHVPTPENHPFKMAAQTLYHGDGPADGTPPAVFERILTNAAAAPMSDSCAAGRTPGSVTAEVGTSSQNGYRNHFVSVTLLSPSVETVKELYAIFIAAFDPLITVIPGLAACFNLIPLGALVKNQDNVLGLEEVAQSGKKVLIVHFAIMWMLAQDDERVEGLAVQVMADCEAAAERAGVLGQWRYLPYANWRQEVIGRYGEKEVAKVRAVKERYDPEGVWGRLVKGGFRVPEKTA